MVVVRCARKQPAVRKCFLNLYKSLMAKMELYLRTGSKSVHLSNTESRNGEKCESK